MSGFDPGKVNETFFAGTTWKFNQLINLGYGDPRQTLRPAAGHAPFPGAGLSGQPDGHPVLLLDDVRQ